MSTILAVTSNIEVTPAAARHITKSLAKRGKGVGIRMGVKTTGCSGLAYTFEYVDFPVKGDIAFVRESITIFVDPKSMTYLAGTTVDFERHGLNEGFSFKNPNERDRCGCGESFRV
jgi:iron-sulfur cluster assembly protein